MSSGNGHDKPPGKYRVIDLKDSKGMMPAQIQQDALDAAEADGYAFLAVVDGFAYLYKEEKKSSDSETPADAEDKPKKKK